MTDKFFVGVGYEREVLAPTDEDVVVQRGEQGMIGG
jgi:hypothetical protein